MSRLKKPDISRARKVLDEFEAAIEQMQAALLELSRSVREFRREMQV